MCLLRGADWIFIQNYGLILVFNQFVLHARSHPHVALKRRTNGRRLENFQKAMHFGKRGTLDIKILSCLKCQQYAPIYAVSYVQVSPTKPCDAISFSAMRATCPAHLTHHSNNIWRAVQPRRPSLCSLLQPPVTSSEARASFSSPFSRMP